MQPVQSCVIYFSGDLLENYCWNDDLMNVSRLLFSVQILLTYPIECFVTRDVIEHSLMGRDPNVPVSDLIHYVLTMGIVGTTYFVSITTNCLGVVLELNVSTYNFSTAFYGGMLEAL